MMTMMMTTTTMMIVDFTEGNFMFFCSLFFLQHSPLFEV